MHVDVSACQVPTNEMRIMLCVSAIPLREEFITNKIIYIGKCNKLRIKKKKVGTDIYYPYSKLYNYL